MLYLICNHSNRTWINIKNVYPYVTQFLSYNLIMLAIILLDIKHDTRKHVIMFIKFDIMSDLILVISLNILPFWPLAPYCTLGDLFCFTTQTSDHIVLYECYKSDVKCHTCNIIRSNSRF